MSTFISGKAWGGARIGADGKVRVWRRAKDKSQQIRWRNSKKKSIVSRAKARGFDRP